ncbi:GIY-YIG nuclease family protein [Streptomyces sp. NPDC008222]|uniref:GIY-YIG nuclease family protein n=1 Tax=Streptomyces sp. NPDC008222 TaxID=3364820 RepID=UPI0036E27C94
MTERVYVVGSPGSRIVKIGRSAAPEKRLWSLQVGSSVPLVLLATFEGGRDLEEALHQYFGAYRKHGEWFELGLNPVKDVRAAVALGLAGLRSGRAAHRPARQALPPAKYCGVDWDMRFLPLSSWHVRTVLAGYGIEQSATDQGEVVFHECAPGRCVDCRAGHPAYLAHPDFIVQETGWEARSWDDRFPETSLLEARRSPLAPKRAGAATA